MCPISWKYYNIIYSDWIMTGFCKSIEKWKTFVVTMYLKTELLKTEIIIIIVL